MDAFEFKAYGSLEHTVENLVNSDINANNFFETLNRIFNTEIIIYKNTIEDVFNDLFISGGSAAQFKIFPTTISIHNKIEDLTSTHSIVLIWNNNILYLYDPNGVYNTEIAVQYTINDKIQWLQQDYGYYCYNEYFNSTEAFQTYIQTKFNISCMVPNTLGAQFLLPLTTENTRYISEGGYCMFFNYMAIEYILRNYNNTNLPDLYHTITTFPFSNVFPKPASKIAARNGTAKPNTFEGETNTIVNNVFNSYGGKKNKKICSRKFKKSKRKTKKSNKKKSNKSKK